MHANMLKDKGFEFISGKWYIRDKEIHNIDKYLLTTGLFPTVKQKDEAKAFFMQCYGTDGEWKPLPIIAEAKAQKELLPLCYPLSHKQLVIINYLLRHDEEIFFILTGVGGSGKSTFANIICQIFDNDTASLNLSDLSDDFKLATGVGHRLIYSDELNSDDINGGQLKQLFSNQAITVNPKFEKPYQTRFQSAFFFNCNIAPRLDLCDTGMMRRILYFEMNEKIQNPDPSMNKRSWTRADLVNIVAHALNTDMTNWKELFQKETRYYLVKDNSVYRHRFLNDYSEYAEACRDDGLRPFAAPKWESIRALLGEWGFIKTFGEDVF